MRAGYGKKLSNSVVALMIVATSPVFTQARERDDFVIGPTNAVWKSGVVSENEHANHVNYVKPQWSLDGRLLSFETVANRQRLLHVYDIEEKNCLELLSASAGGNGLSLSVPGRRNKSRATANFDLDWSQKKADRLVFVGGGDLGHFGVFKVDFYILLL